jgi:hypothetical protein
MAFSIYLVDLLMPWDSSTLIKTIALCYRLRVEDLWRKFTSVDAAGPLALNLKWRVFTSNLKLSRISSCTTPVVN